MLLILIIEWIFEMDWKNKTAVITGAASGIGRGIAKKINRIRYERCIG